MEAALKLFFNYKFVFFLFFCVMTPQVFAGAGYYVTVTNNSAFQFIATGKGGGGNACWYSSDLDNNIHIEPHTQKRFYTESSNSYIICSHGQRGYQRFLIYSNTPIKSTQFSLVSSSPDRDKYGTIVLYTYLKNEASTYKTLSLLYNPFITYCASIYIDEDGNIDDSKMRIYNC